MNETIEDQLRRVLAQAAIGEVPDATPIPPRRPVDELTERRAHRRWLAPLITGIAAAVIAVIATLAVVRPTDSGGTARPAQVAMPQVAGLRLVDAEHSITAAGLTVGAVTSVESASVPKGMVATQEPGPGTPVTIGTSVDLAVSKGVTAVPVPDLVAVPDVRTLSAAEAEAQLKARHLVTKTVRVTSTDAEKNTVVSQSPAANKQVKAGGIVTVRVGSGPDFTTVPSKLVGLTYDQAVAVLKSANLTATQQVVDGVQPINTVVKVADPKPGASAPEGTPVVLQTSNNQLFVVPNLANLSPEDAASQLNSVGWTGSADSFQKWASPTTDNILIGKIASGAQLVTNPDGGGTLQKRGQDPAVGATVLKTAPFKVVVYAKKQIALPTFTPGVTSTDDAVGQLQNLGVTDVTVITQKPAPSAGRGNTYISMTPASGSVVDFDTPITITVWGDTQPPSTAKSRPTTPTK